jgi:antitoxin component of MazEF toxin-antitoxin module
LTKIEKSGKDLVIRLLRDVVRSVRFRAGMELDIEVLVDQLSIRRTGTPRRRSKYRIQDLLKGWKGEYPHRKVLNDAPVGKELI